MITFLPDNPSLYPTLTVAEHLQFKAKAFRTPKELLRKKVEYALEVVNLESYADRYAGNLSRGQKQRVLLAGAILQDAELYLLDEPTVGLDIPSKQWLTQWVKKNAENQKSVLISSHSLDFILETAHRVLLLKDGKIMGERYIPSNHEEIDSFCKQVIRDLGGVVEDD
jgi:ABC-2 type transport system ATP-binding protein